jgi:methionyl-tRNA formyltransferase
MRIVFMGSPDFAVPTLDTIVGIGHEIIAVYTQPPRPAGRGKALQPTAVDARAQALGLIVRRPTSLKGPVEQAEFAELNADVAVVAAYGLILPRAILSAPRHGCLNVHASLLPRWRGAAPVQRAIMTPDSPTTGVTIMKMEEGLDTGPMLLQREVPIGRKNSAQLTEELSRLGAYMMSEVLARLSAIEPQEQDEDKASYARKISKAEARLNFESPATVLQRRIQGLAPFPGAWFEARGERIKVLDAEVGDDRAPPGTVIDNRLTIACGVGTLRPMLLQRAGKAPLALDDFLRGFPIPMGTILQ